MSEHLRVEINYCKCHPETCCCAEYRLVRGTKVLMTGSKEACNKVLRLYEVPTDAPEPYTSHTGATCIDWDDDPQNQLSIVAKDGRVTFAAFHHGQKVHGVASGPEFMAALRRFANTTEGAQPVAWLYEHMMDYEWRKEVSLIQLDHTFVGSGGAYVKGIPLYAAPAAQAAEPNGKLVGWWNGIMPDATSRSLQEPSVRWGKDGENSRHDIPLYDGYNPIHYHAPTAPSAPAGVDEAMTRKIITDTIGFDFEADAFQTVNADDLLRIAAALQGKDNDQET